MSIFNAPPKPVVRSTPASVPTQQTTPATASAPAAAPAASSSTESNDSTAPEKDPDLKIILLGDSAVGKSKLVERFLMNDYVPRQMSTYALTVFRHQHKTADGKQLEVDFWVRQTERELDRRQGYFSLRYLTPIWYFITLSPRLGYCRPRALLINASILLFPCSRLYSRVRCDA